MKVKAKPKPKKRVRRVVLGVGYPWFIETWAGMAKGMRLFTGKSGYDPGRGTIKIGSLGYTDKIRLVAEVLK